MIRKNWRLSGVLSVMPVLPIALIARCARDAVLFAGASTVRCHASGAAGMIGELINADPERAMILEEAAGISGAFASR